MAFRRWVALLIIGLIAAVGVVAAAYFVTQTREQVAVLPTLEILPSATASLTPTNPPTNSPTARIVIEIVTATPLSASATPLPSATFTVTPSATFTVPPSATITDTKSPVTGTPSPIESLLQATVAPTSATEAVQAVAAQTYYVTVGSANLRACARRDCAIVAPLLRGDAVTVVGYAVGDVVSGSNIWFSVHVFSYQGYVHSSLLALTLPATATYTPFYVEHPQDGGIVVGGGSAPTTAPTAALAGGGFPCADGTISHAAHRQGACSHHGGIAPGY